MMIYSIIPYGNPVLRKKTIPLKKDHPSLSELINDLFLTMYNAKGVGLAAPQIGLSLRLFVIDLTPFKEDQEFQEIQDQVNLKHVFINPKLMKEQGEEWKFNEGCLSIPNIREDVFRKEAITLEFYDEKWAKHVKTFKGIFARVIQHEYDHLEGVLFTDKLSAFKKRLIKGKLSDIKEGKINVQYKMKF